jgi:hypothetical protein
MDMLAQFGFYSNLTPDACSLYGLIMLVMSVWLALNLKQPKKED